MSLNGRSVRPRAVEICAMSQVSDDINMYLFRMVHTSRQRKQLLFTQPLSIGLKADVSRPFPFHLCRTSTTQSCSFLHSNDSKRLTGTESFIPLCIRSSARPDLAVFTPFNDCFFYSFDDSSFRTLVPSIFRTLSVLNLGAFSFRLA